MKPANHISSELHSISPLLAEMDKINVFVVPQGYFDGLSVRILSNINPGKVGFAVPQGYFESLADLILLKVKKEASTQQESASTELRKISPLLYSLQGENVFAVPRGYFAQFAEGIVERVKPAKLRVMTSGRKIIRYAMAAMIAGIIATSFWWIANTATERNGYASVPSYFQDSKQYKTVEQIEAGIENIPDEAIIRYLESTGTDADNALLANNIIGTDLPEESDYLLNEKTLEIYLNEIDVQTEN